MDCDLRIGEWLVDLHLGHVVGKGRTVRLKPMVLRLLRYFAENAGLVISKKRLINEVWDGTHVTDDALTHSISELRKAFGDDARHPEIIATIPKRGYRMIAPVVVEKPGRAAKRGMLRVAVLPFENLSTDPGQDFFSHAMTDLVITELARSGALRVISQTSVMGYQRPRKPLPAIARELGADRIVEGAVLRCGDRVRITVRLLDTADEHLWAEIYERDWADILEVQRDVAPSIVREILTHQGRRA